MCLFCLLGCTFLNFITESRLFLFLLVFCVLFCFYFLPMLIGISELQASLLPSPGYTHITGKKEIQGTVSCCSRELCHIVLQAPGSLANIPSLHSVFCCLFFICCIQEFSCVQCKKCVSLFCLKLDILNGLKYKKKKFIKSLFKMKYPKIFNYLKYSATIFL